MNEQENNLKEVMEQLSVLEPSAADAPRSVGQAYAQLQKVVTPPKRSSWLAGLRSSLIGSQRRMATAVSFAVLVLVISFSFPAVRAAASDLLSLFRVQKFAAISVSPEQLAILAEVAEQGIMPGEVLIDQEPGALTPADSLADAAVVTGMTAVRTLPTLGSPTQIFISGGGAGQLIINEANSRRLLSAANLDPNLLPEGIDGARIIVATFSGVEQRWADGTTLLQTDSPVVQYPDALDPAVLGEALLQVLGLNALEANRLAQQIDWTSTLLLPIPSSLATFQEMTVHGVSGIGLSSLDGQLNALVWQENGRLYLLAGDQPVTELATLANGLE